MDGMTNMIGLRSDTVTAADHGHAEAMFAAPRWATTSTAKTPRINRARGRGTRPCSGTRPALFTRPARWRTRSPSDPGRAGRRNALRRRRACGHAYEIGARPRGVRWCLRRGPGRRSAATSAPSWWPSMVRPDGYWAVPTRAIAVEQTLQPGRRRRDPVWTPLTGLRQVGRQRSAWPLHCRRRPHLARHVADGVPLADLRRGCSTTLSRLPCPRASAPRSARCSCPPPSRIGPGSVPAQAHGWWHASGRQSWPRPAATRVEHHIVRAGRRPPQARGWPRRWPRSGSSTPPGCVPAHRGAGPGPRSPSSAPALGAAARPTGCWCRCSVRGWSGDHAPRRGRRGRGRAIDDADRDLPPLTGRPAVLTRLTDWQGRDGPTLKAGTPHRQNLFAELRWGNRASAACSRPARLGDITPQWTMCTGAGFGCSILHEGRSLARPTGDLVPIAPAVRVSQGGGVDQTTIVGRTAG